MIYEEEDMRRHEQEAYEYEQQREYEDQCAREDYEAGIRRERQEQAMQECKRLQDQIDSLQERIFILQDRQRDIMNDI